MTNVATMTDPVAPLVRHGQIQLQIKAGGASSYDALALGFLAVIVAILTLVVGVRDTIGSYWWTLLPPLVGAMAECLWELYMPDLHAGLPLRAAIDLYRGYTEEGVNEGLVIDLVITLAKADALLARKRVAVSRAILLIGIASVIAIVLLTA
jgi:hypothetical protein